MPTKRELLEERTVKELKEMAREKEISGYSNLRKSELIDLIPKNYEGSEVRAWPEVEEEPEEASEEEAGKPQAKRKFGFETSYNPEEHGPLVEIPKLDNVIETYVIREPYSKVAIRRDPSIEERLYDVFEPPLTESEREKKEYLRELLLNTVDFSIEKFKQDGKKRYLRDKIDDLNVQ